MLEIPRTVILVLDSECCGILGPLFAILLSSGRRSEQTSRPEGYNHMRLKLVLICSLIAAVAGAGSAIAIILAVFSSLRPITTPGVLVASTYLLPATATLLSSIFVYRHTAKRRRLQAILTVIISLVLTILLFVLASIITARRAPAQPLPSPVATL
jgi:small-conductance mechanosensitive channel